MTIPGCDLGFENEGQDVLPAEPNSLTQIRLPEYLMKNSLTKSIRNFLVSEDGPTAVEYAVMLALIIVVCLAAVSAVGSNANGKFNKVRLYLS